MAYRRKSSSRTRSRSYSSGRRVTNRRTTRRSSNRRSTGSRRASVQTVRLVLEQAGPKLAADPMQAFNQTVPRNLGRAAF